MNYAQFTQQLVKQFIDLKTGLQCIVQKINYSMLYI
jgi:hypothetical protein